MSIRSVALVALLLSLGLSGPAPAAAGDDPLSKGLELFHKKDYKNARVELEKSLVANADADAVRGLLARIAYFYAEDGVARDHLSKIQTKSADDQRLELILDTPFKNDYKDALAIMEGPSDRGHYYVATDLGFEQAQWDKVKAEYAKLAAAVAKDKKKQKQLDAFMKQARTPGLDVCQKALDDIVEQYSSLITFKKDEKLVARVIICKERADYLDFALKLTGSDKSDTGGFYSPSDRLLLVSSSDRGKRWGPLWQTTREIMFHEAFHQFIDNWANPPSWLNEGLAEFFRPSEEDPQTKKLRLGVLQRESVGTGLTSYQEFQGALKPTAVFKPYPIPELLRMSQAKFYASDEKDKYTHEMRMAANYAEGWGLCYFLVMGHKGGRTIIMDYIKALRDGKSNDEAIAVAFKDFKTDADWEKLEKEWRRYMAALATDAPPAKKSQ